MSRLQRWRSATALSISLSFGGVTLAPMIAPMVAPAPAVAQNLKFRDVSANYWATPFIAALVERGVIAGFPNGTFQPNSPVTRAQFAAMVNKAFQKPLIRGNANFRDLPARYWANPAILEAYRMGFVSGYPNNSFKPNQSITKEQVLTALANGLNYEVAGSVNSILDYYNDEANISDFAILPIAAASERNLVVNYPNLQNLNPTRPATRAEVAAMIYQALVREGQVSAIASNYIVNRDLVATKYRIPAGTAFPVAYDKERILVTNDETVNVTLTISAKVITDDDKLLIPAGSRVVGELRPTEGGTRFYSRELVIPGGETIPFNATSGLVTTTQRLRNEEGANNLIRNAALGTTAAAAISALTGNLASTTRELIIGGTANTVSDLVGRFRDRDSIDLLVIDPSADLALTLQEDTVVAAQPQ